MLWIGQDVNEVSLVKEAYLVIVEDPDSHAIQLMNEGVGSPGLRDDRLKLGK